MLGREPRLSHVAMRWLIISLMVVNGLQLVLLQATINATLSLDFDQVWLFVGLSFAALVVSVRLIAFGFLAGKKK